MEKKAEIINFETGREKNEKSLYEESLERLNYCAKQEGLPDGLNSKNEEIEALLREKKNSLLPEFDFSNKTVPLKQQLALYLEAKYSDYLWR